MVVQLPEGRGLTLTREVFAVAQRHDVERLGCRHHGGVARPGMIGMAMGDQSPRHWPHGVDIKIAARTIKPERRQ